VSKGRVLLVDSDPAVRSSLRGILEVDGYLAAEAPTLRAGLESFHLARPDAMVLAARLEDGAALELISHVKAVDAMIPCIVLARREELDLAAEAIQTGAEQFLVKPIQLPTFLLVLDRVLENQRNRRKQLREEARRSREHVDPFAGSSAAIRRLAERAQRVAGSELTVLIHGETGSGKGVLAGWIHRNGPRSAECFLDLNCAGLSPEFLESELFGHEKGAFTSAIAAKMGLLEVAHRGTLFLDEIADVPLTVQPKLLKVLEEKKFRRLGDVRERQVDVRLIAASHQDLGHLVHAKRFREDLYFRINTVVLEIPPLRDRPEDLHPLADIFLSDRRRASAAASPSLARGAAEARGLLLAGKHPRVEERPRACRPAVPRRRDRARRFHLPAAPHDRDHRPSGHDRSARDREANDSPRPGKRAREGRPGGGGTRDFAELALREDPAIRDRRV
jgi:DNA-binding NtrC family response regulator